MTSIIASYQKLCYFTVGSDYTAVGVNPDSGGNSNLRYRRDRDTPNIPFTVDILGDNVPEPVEVVQVQLRCEDGENCYSPRSFYTITIIDDEGGCQIILCVFGGDSVVYFMCVKCGWCIERRYAVSVVCCVHVRVRACEGMGVCTCTCEGVSVRQLV